LRAACGEEGPRPQTGNRNRIFRNFGREYPFGVDRGKQAVLYQGDRKRECPDAYPQGKPGIGRPRPPRQPPRSLDRMERPERTGSVSRAWPPETGARECTRVAIETISSASDAGKVTDMAPLARWKDRFARADCVCIVSPRGSRTTRSKRKPLQRSARSEPTRRCRLGPHDGRPAPASRNAWKSQTRACTAVPARTRGVQRSRRKNRAKLKPADKM